MTAPGTDARGALLSAEDLAVARGGLAVLRGVSFSLMPGEVLVLRGPNGSGKTTLLRTLAGLQKPLGGRVVSDPDSIAYAAHADGLKATLSVAENLTFWAGIYGGGNIDAALGAFDIADLHDRMAGSLSAGQKRRLGLARLLVTGRRVWALDEPTVSLDASSVALFADAVRAHAAAGGAAVIATHIDLGLEARVLDITTLRARAEPDDKLAESFDGAFL